MPENKELSQPNHEETKPITVREEGHSFLDREGKMVVLAAANQRQREIGEEHKKTEVYPGDFKTLKYKHYENAEEARADQWRSAELAKARLDEFKRGETDSVATGIEIEGTLYDNEGNMLTVHKDTVTFDDAPPELYDAQLEVLTGKTENGQYPSTALEIADTLTKAVKKGEQIAQTRNGLFVLSSAPEGGSSDQLRLTEHPKVLSSFERGQTGVTPEAPLEVSDLAKRAGLTDMVPFHGTHVHTSNPEFSDGQLDGKAAYAAGILEHTQLSQVESFMLANTRDYLGIRLNHIKDVRSIMKRAALGAQGGEIPNNAYDWNKESITALEEGETHEMSRHPVEEQHNKVRPFKELGTTESVGGAANPDMRLIMAHTYFKQLTRVLSYEALAATGGDESKVLSYLQNDFEEGKYGYLFKQLETKNGQDSNFEQDKRFNMDGFEAGDGIKSYREQLQDIREIVRRLGKDYSAFRTQARIVDHVLGKIAEHPDPNISLAEYMDPETGMKGGIVTDYKSNDIAENIRAQAEGTKKQVDMLQNIHTEKQLLEFFGIKENRDKTLTLRHTTPPVRRK